MSQTRSFIPKLLIYLASGLLNMSVPDVIEVYSGDASFSLNSIIK